MHDVCVLGGGGGTGREALKMGCFELCLMILISSVKLDMLILSHSNSSFWTVFVWEAHLCLKVHLYMYNLLHSLSVCLKEHTCTASSSPPYQNTHVQPPLLFTRVFEGTPVDNLHSSLLGCLKEHPCTTFTPLYQGV